MWGGHGVSSAFWAIPQCSEWLLLWGSHLNDMHVVAVSDGQDLPIVPLCKSLSVTNMKSINVWVLRWDWPVPAPSDQTLVLLHVCQLLPALKVEQGLGGPACGTMSHSTMHWQGFDICSLLCLAAREARRYLHLPPVRAHGRETHCLHPGGQEPEEDGCWGSLR